MPVCQNLSLTVLGLQGMSKIGNIINFLLFLSILKKKQNYISLHCQTEYETNAIVMSIDLCVEGTKTKITIPNPLRITRKTFSIVSISSQFVQHLLLGKQIEKTNRFRRLDCYCTLISTM
jgi:AAA15 family ATPase/GTPase